MRKSARLLAEQEFIEDQLSHWEICARCHANLRNYADLCSADLSAACPGFMKIEETRARFNRRFKPESREPTKA